MFRVLSLGVSLALVAVAGPVVYVAAQDQSPAGSTQPAPSETAGSDTSDAGQAQAEAASADSSQVAPAPSDVVAPSAPVLKEPPVLVGKAGTNLQVLPIDTKLELMKAMDEFSKSLGVTCVFCHVLDDPQNGFARDDKEHKLVAREMIRIRNRINEDLDPLLGPNAVSCFTCHRGDKHPARAMPTEAEKKKADQ